MFDNNICLFYSGFMSFSAIFQSYQDAVWMWQGAQCLLLVSCLTEISHSRHMAWYSTQSHYNWHQADQFQLYFFNAEHQVKGQLIQFLKSFLCLHMQNHWILKNVWMQSKGLDDTLRMLGLIWMHRLGMSWICAFCTCLKANFCLTQPKWRFSLGFFFFFFLRISVCFIMVFCKFCCTNSVLCLLISDMP